MWKVIATQNEEAWLDDYIRDVITNPLPPQPPHDQRIGHIDTHWHQVGPGQAYVASNPLQGTPDDRRFAEWLITAQLAPHGLKRAVYTFTWDHDDMRKVAQWGDIENNAKWLIQNGKVQLLRNGYNSVVGQVGSQTDPGQVYQTEISRDDPQSQAITGSTCTCDWGQFQNTPRTRQWKRFQDRPCKHILATQWVSAATPLDEDRAPGNAPGQQGQMSFPGMEGPTQAPSSMGIMQQTPWQAPGGLFAPQTAVPQDMGAGGPQNGLGGLSGPSPADVLPQFPMDPSMQPAVNPSSVPGQRPGPTPTNPIQYPGGTFSSVQSGRLSDVQFSNGDIVQLNDEDYGTLVGRSPEHGAGQPHRLRPGSQGEVLGTDPASGLVNVLYMGSDFDNRGPMEPYGATAWHWPSSLTPRPDIRKPGPAVRRPRGVH